MKLHRSNIIILICLLFVACTNGTPTPVSQDEPHPNPTVTVTDIPPTLTQVVAATPQPYPTPVTYGPEELPEGFNPLSGQRVSDPARLEYPAILLSVSHFPPAARPQAGFSFTPWVYEYYITEGSTRHLAVVYGEFPAPEIPLHGECEVRTEPVRATNVVLGNRIWQDVNENGIQDPREGGVGGICVNLLGENGNTLQQTTTDSNGYFGFDVEAGRYIIEVKKPFWLEFTQKNVGDEESDSDVDPSAGRTDAIHVSDSSLLFWDAGLIPSQNMGPTPDPSTKLSPAEVGPIRSGRIFYRYMGAMYQDSCLIYASADEEVLSQIPGCATVAHTTTGGGAMLPLERMARISEQNKKFNPNFNYASHLFSDIPPANGTPVTELREYWALLNQSKWMYDSASGSWWRYVDESDPKTAGVLHNDVDRLSGRQLQFENIIVLFAEHIVIKPTIVDINLAPGSVGKAVLFRDGQMYPIKWSTVATAYQQKTGRGQPIHFTDLEGAPAALKPGKTWVILFDMQSYLEEVSEGIYRARFVAPAGAKTK